ncbi:NAD(P)/FAD-dependent oxidoreductase [Mycobacterium tuberculosis]|uniref:NAD(P)/FAD-dependent oxidoreductase n=1 Tax=Mycobacterium tuberculosis TaxID=1773 RepID=UPI00272B1897|nr:NAD(P)/FAD-dependent oxidoreductase [Mycobacterium tuberculosis]
MEATAIPGLYFIGEVVDVTGWLGGLQFPVGVEFGGGGGKGGVAAQMSFSITRLTGIGLSKPVARWPRLTP